MTQTKRVGSKKLIRRGKPRPRKSAGVASKVRDADERVRCRWASNPLAIRYHDREWGVPQHKDRVLFEFLILEGAQAGLSWDTILKKRENYRAAFDGFDPAKIARYDRRKVQTLLGNEGIIRNRLKVASAIANARAFLAVQKEFGSFDRYVWQFVGGKPRVNAWHLGGRLPARTEESDALSKDLKKRGFNFVGSTICYAFMQAMGLVNDHAVECFRYKALLAVGS
jgi:DNA-3-methyladenine glycosylase I